jgi:murein DD-endopeptidase MepM/ murein hydrolase activator NlpD
MILRPVARRTRWQRAKNILGRKVTVLLVPHTPLRPWRVHFSLSFLLFALTGWSLLTVWAGYIAGRNFDYWVTKADNQVLRMKMEYFEDEFDRARQSLSVARKTDLGMRQLLAMRSRRAIIESGEGVGGPGPHERPAFAQALRRATDGLSQPEFRREALELQEESRRRLASFEEIAWYIVSQRSLYRAIPNVWPAVGHITSGFGYRLSPFNAEGSGEFHSGVDIANAAETRISATADGVVRFAGWQGGYGRVVLIDHGFGISTLYGHASRLAVRVGQQVRRGQVIAYMGTTGRSTSEHLHYEVWRDGKPVNPKAYLQGGPESAKKIEAREVPDE